MPSPYDQFDGVASANPYTQFDAPVSKRTLEENVSLFSDLSKVGATLPEADRLKFDEMLSMSASPDDDRARAALTSYFADRYQKPADEVATYFTQYSRDFAKSQFNELSDMSPTALYGRIGVELKKDVDEQEMLKSSLQSLYKAAIGGETDLIKAWQAGEAERRANPGYRPERADAYRAVAKQSWGDMVVDALAYSTEIEAISKYLKAELAGGENASIIDIGEDSKADALTAAKEALFRLPMEEAEKAIALASIVSGKTREDSFASKFGSSFSESFLDVAENVQTFGLRPIAAATEDSRAAIGDVNKLARISYLLRQARMGTGRLDGGNAVSRALLNAVRSVPYMSFSLSPAGIATNIASTKEAISQRYQDGGITPAQANNIASIAALPYVALEFVHAKMVLGGKLPGFEKLLTAPVKTGGGLLARSATVGALQHAEQYAQEVAQNLTAPVTQQFASWLSSEVPDVKWGEELKGIADAAPETMAALVPFVLVGTGVGTFKDRAYGQQYLNQTRYAKAMGFSEELSAQIAEAPTLELKQQIIRDNWDSRKTGTPEQAAALREIDAEVQAVNESQFKVEKIGDNSFAIIDPSGEQIDTTNSPEAAAQLVRDHEQASEATLTQTILDMKAYTEGFLEPGQSVEMVGEKKTLAQQVKEGLLTPAAARDAIRVATELGNLEEGTTPETALVAGENVASFDIKDRIFKDVSRIYEGAAPETIIEERAEGYMKRRLAAGDVTLEQVHQWRESVGDTDFDRSERATLEWFSQQSTAYLFGKAMNPRVPKTFQAYLRKLKEYFAKIMTMAAKLTQMERDGTLAEDFRTHLAQAVGLDRRYLENIQPITEPLAPAEFVGIQEGIPGKIPDFELYNATQKIGNTPAGSTVARATIEKAGYKLPERPPTEAELSAMRDAERDAALEDAGQVEGDELLDAVRSLGGLTAPSNEAVFSGELKIIRENLSKGGALKIFRKKALSLDALRGALVERGFNFETVSEMLDALDSSSRGETHFPTGWRDTSQSSDITFSLKQAETPEFKKWFGESKVVDAQGKPLVVYHGTDAEFNVFSKQGAQGSRRLGFFFTDSASYSRNYGRPMHVFLKIEKPKRVRAEWFDANNTRENAKSGFWEVFRQEAESAGNDGIVIERDEIFAGERIQRSEFVVFKPAQIKSATGNRGTFAPENPDITFSLTSEKKAIELQSKFRERRVTQRIANREGPAASYPEEVAKLVKEKMYEIRELRKEHAAVQELMAKGVAEAERLFFSDANALHPMTKIGVGLALSETYAKAGDYDKAADMAERVAELGTQAGQAINMFKLLGAMLDTPDKALAFFARQRGKVKKTVRENPANEAAAEEIKKELDANSAESKRIKALSEQIEKLVKLLNEGTTTEIADEITPEPKASDSPRIAELKKILADAKKALKKELSNKVDPDAIRAGQLKNKIEEATRLLNEGTTAEIAASLSRKTKRVTEEIATLQSMLAEARKALRGELKSKLDEHSVKLRNLRAIIEENTRLLNEGTSEQIRERLGRNKQKILPPEDLAQLQKIAAESRRALEKEIAEPTDFEARIIKRMRARNLDTPKQVRDAIKRVIELKDEGKLPTRKISDIIAEKYTVPDMTSEERAQLADMAGKVARLPQNSVYRADAVLDMMNFMNDKLQGIGIADKSWAIWYAGILSGYNTAFRNSFGNAVELAATSAVDAFVRNPAEWHTQVIKGLYGSKRGAVTGFKEGYQHFAPKGLNGLIKDPLAKTNSIIGRDEADKFQSGNVLERHTFKGGKLNPYNYLKFVGRSLRAQDAVAFHTAYELKSFQAAAEMVEAEGLEGPEAEARVAQLLNLTDIQQKEFNDRAAAEFDNLEAGDVNESKEAFVKRRVIELTQMERDAALVERATDYANRVTYNYKPEGVLGVIAEGIGSMLRETSSRIPGESKKESTARAIALALPRLIVPFTRVVANVTNRQLDFIIGAPRAAFKNTFVLEAGRIKGVEKTADQRAIELKKGIVGNAGLAALLTLLWPEDDDEQKTGLTRLHAGGPSNPEARRALEKLGWKPWSLQVGDKYYPFRYLPIGVGLASVAEMHDHARYKERDDETVLKRIGYATSAVGAATLDASFLSNMSDFMEAVGQRDPDARATALNRFIQRTFNAGNLVPFSNLVNNVTTDLDKFDRDRNGAMAFLASQVPVSQLRGKPALDIFGDEVQNRAFEAFVGRAKADGPEERLYRLMVEKSAFPSGLRQYQGKMEPEQFYEFQRIRGQVLKQLMLRGESNLRSAKTEDDAKDIVYKLSRIATLKAKTEVGYVEPKE